MIDYRRGSQLKALIAAMCAPTHNPSQVPSIATGWSLSDNVLEALRPSEATFSCENSS